MLLLLAPPPLKDRSLPLAREHGVAAWQKKKRKYMVCVVRRAKWLHSVSSSDSFLSKPRARHEVSLRGVSSSDLLHSVSIKTSMSVIVGVALYMSSVEMNKPYCIFKTIISCSFSCAALVEIQLR